MSNLASLLEMHREIEKQLFESEGLITPDLEKMMTELDITLPAKIDAYAFTIEKLEQNIDWFKAKEEEYKKYRDGHARMLEGIKSRLKDLMLQNKLTELLGERESFRVQKSNPSLNISDEGVIPSNYLIEETKIYPDKEKIKTDLKSGIPVPGCELKVSYALKKKVKK